MTNVESTVTVLEVGQELLDQIAVEAREAVDFFRSSRYVGPDFLAKALEKRVRGKIAEWIAAFGTTREAFDALEKMLSDVVATYPPARDQVIHPLQGLLSDITRKALAEAYLKERSHAPPTSASETIQQIDEARARLNAIDPTLTLYMDRFQKRD